MSELKEICQSENLGKYISMHNIGVPWMILLHIYVLYEYKIHIKKCVNSKAQVYYVEHNSRVPLWHKQERIS